MLMLLKYWRTLVIGALAAAVVVLWFMAQLAARERDMAMIDAQTARANYELLYVQKSAIMAELDSVIANSKKRQESTVRIVKEIANVPTSNVCTESEPIRRTIDWLRNNGG